MRAIRQASVLSKDDPVVAVNTSVLLFKNNLNEEGVRYLEKFRSLVDDQEFIDGKVNKLIESKSFNFVANYCYCWKSIILA